MDEVRACEDIPLIRTFKRRNDMGMPVTIGITTVGDPYGVGKSFLAIWLAYQLDRANGVSTVPIDWLQQTVIYSGEELFDRLTRRFMRSPKRFKCLVIDDAEYVFNARTWNENVDKTNVIDICRKAKVNIIYTTPNLREIDVNIRENTRFIIKTYRTDKEKLKFSVIPVKKRVNPKKQGLMEVFFDKSAPVAQQRFNIPLERMREDSTLWKILELYDEYDTRRKQILTLISRVNSEIRRRKKEGLPFENLKKLKIELDRRVVDIYKVTDDECSELSKLVEKEVRNYSEDNDGKKECKLGLYMLKTKVLLAHYFGRSPLTYEDLAEIFGLNSGGGAFHILHKCFKCRDLCSDYLKFYQKYEDVIRREFKRYIGN